MFRHVDKNTQVNLLKKWRPYLNRGKQIDSMEKAVSTAMVMETTARHYMKPQSSSVFSESWGGEAMGATAATGSTTGGMFGDWANDNTKLGIGDARVPSVIIPTLRRLYPELIAHEVMGVQPMHGPVGVAYAIRALYGANRAGVGADTSIVGKEIGYNNIFSDQSGAAGLTAEDKSANFSNANYAPGSMATGAGPGFQVGSNTQADFWAAFTGTTSAAAVTSGLDAQGQGAPLGTAEFWKVGTDMPQVGIDFMRGAVEAQTRKLGAQWSREAAEDMESMLGLDMDSEMVKILSGEVRAQIDRQCLGEMVKAVVAKGVVGKHLSSWTPAQADGRHQLERLGTLYTQFLLAGKRIGINSRRGQANFAVADANTVALLERMGEYTLDSKSVDVDSTSFGVAVVGSIRKGGIKVVCDTFGGSQDGSAGYILLGHKGATAYDAGVVYCPYIPLELVRGVGQEDGSPRVFMRTRYGMLNNLFGSEHYYHLIKLSGLTGTMTADVNFTL